MQEEATWLLQLGDSVDINRSNATCGRHAITQRLVNAHTAGITWSSVSVLLSAQVGIVTLQTAREVAAEDGVAEASLDPQDERVGAVIVTGAQLM